MKKFIGLRTIKTGLVVMLAIMIGRLLELEYPFFIAMTALISMDKTMGNSFVTGRNRVVGTFFGAIIGVSLSYIDRGNAVLCGIGMMILIVICNQLKLRGSITVGGFVMIAIMVHTDKTPLFYGFHRTFDTLIGAFLSFVVNALVFPYATDDKLDDLLVKMWEISDDMIATLDQNDVNGIHRIKRCLDAVYMDIDAYHNERILPHKKELLDSLQKHYDVCEQMYIHLDILLQLDKERYLEVYEYHHQEFYALYQSFVQEI